MREKLIKLADELDKAGLTTEANSVDQVLQKMALDAGSPGGSLKPIKKNLDRIFQVIRNLPDDPTKIPGDGLRRAVKAMFDQLNKLVDAVVAANPQNASALKKVDTLVNQNTSI